MSRRNNKKTLRKRSADGWKNINRGLGSDRDVKSSTYYTQSTLKTYLHQELNSLYTQDWMGGKVADIPVDDAMREGAIIEHEDAEVIAEVEKRMTELCLEEDIDDLVKWARVFGSAVMIAVTSDNDMAGPVNAIGKGDLKNFAVLDRFDIFSTQRDNNPLSKTYFDPLSYQLSKAGWSIDPSRVIKIDGVTATNYTKQLLNGWGLSIYERGYSTITDSQTSTNWINNLLAQSNVDIFKIKGLNEAITNDKDDAIAKARISAAQDMKSIINGIALDSEDDYVNISKSFAGLNEINMGMLSLVSGAFDIPLTRLLGKGADGLNATGEGDLKNYYDKVRSLQTTDIKQAYEFALKFISFDLFGEDKKLTVSFPPLFQLSAHQQAELENKNALTDQTHINNGTIDETDARKRLAQSEMYPSITVELIAKEEALLKEIDEGIDED